MFYKPELTGVRLNTQDDYLLCAVGYGSRLFGTSTPDSDYDFQAVYLPGKRGLLLAKKPETHKYKFDADGNTVPHDSPMPANGWEVQETPVQNFAAHWLKGETYAVEMVFGVLQGYAQGHVGWDYETLVKDSTCAQAEFYRFCELLVEKYLTSNVQGMTGFAMKQTLDYVHRADRMKAVQQLLVALGQYSHFNRLDDVEGDFTVLELLAEECGLEVGSTTNNNRQMKTLMLNGRDYLETTGLMHLEQALHKLLDAYGERTKKTASSDVKVEWKALSHAVRVYEQVLELLRTGFMTFPRPNAKDLLMVKQGLVPLEEVKECLVELDAQVVEAMVTTELQKKTPQLEEELKDDLYRMLEGQY